MNGRNTSIDLAKFVASLMIVAIHTGLFSDVNETLSFAVVHILCRLAVPFFAIGTGYFLCRPAQNLKAVFWRQWKKLVILYGVWTVLYLFHSIPIWIEIGWFSPFAFVDYAVGTVTKGSHYHFWYLWGMIYTLPVFYLLLKTVPGKILPVLAAGFWVLKAATYCYGGFLPASGLLDLLQKADGFLCLLPLLLTGAVIAGQKGRNNAFYALGFAVFGLCLTIEAFLLRNAGQSAFSYILFTLPTGYFLVRLILGTNICVPATVGRTLGQVSMFVYCVHPMIVELTEDVFHSSMVHFGFTAVMSTALGFAYLYIRKMIGKKVKKCST